jgi:hypothetical protein
VPDPGPDGATGTGDEGVVQALNLMSPAPGVRNVTTNVPGFEAAYKTTEVSLQKRHADRWSLVASFSYTWTKEHARTYYGNAFANLGSGASLYGGNSAGGAAPNNPNDHTLNDFTTWALKLHGTYEAGWGLRLTPVLKSQSGQPYGRIVSAGVQQGITYGTQLILVEPIGTRRQDTVTTVDLRAEKRFEVGQRARISAFLDVFNVFNSNVATNIRWTTGRLAVGSSTIPTFGTPTSILPPRIAKLGLKLDW